MQVNSKTASHIPFLAAWLGVAILGLAGCTWNPATYWQIRRPKDLTYRDSGLSLVTVRSTDLLGEPTYVLSPVICFRDKTGASWEIRLNSGDPETWEVRTCAPGGEPVVVPMDLTELSGALYPEPTWFPDFNPVALPSSRARVNSGDSMPD